MSLGTSCCIPCSCSLLEDLEAADQHCPLLGFLHDEVDTLHPNLKPQFKPETTGFLVAYGHVGFGKGGGGGVVEVATLHETLQNPKPKTL